MSNSDVKHLIENLEGKIINEINKLPKQGESKLWKIFTVVLPIVLSMGLGIIIFVTESQISKQIEDQSTLYLTQLAVAEHYTKQKLQIYSDITELMTLLVVALQLANVDNDHKTSAIESLSDLWLGYKTKGIFIDDGIETDLEELWITGTSLTYLKKVSGSKSPPAGLQSPLVQIEEFAKKVSMIEKKMEKDLNIVSIKSPTPQ